jgi:hypothetical protein
MSEMAGSVLQETPRILSQIDALKSKLGPAAGRWNDLWVNKAGFNDPDFAALDQDLDLLASALVVTHFGGRGGQEYRKVLRERFGAAQSPDDLKARIQTAEKWLKNYEAMDKKTKDATPGPSNNRPPLSSFEKK